MSRPAMIWPDLLRLSCVFSPQIVVESVGTVCMSVAQLAFLVLEKNESDRSVLRRRASSLAGVDVSHDGALSCGLICVDALDE